MCRCLIVSVSPVFWLLTVSPFLSSVYWISGSILGQVSPPINHDQSDPQFLPGPTRSIRTGTGRLPFPAHALAIPASHTPIS